jgi:benzoate membrane transport protein
MRASMVSAALVAALVGYGGTIAVVLAAAAAVGATPGQTASWVLAVCLAKAIGSAALSAWTRMPVLLAWSTPGAALVAASSGITMAEAAGAFVVAGLLIVLTGVLRPLGRAVAAIPDGVAAGMLAGVLLPFCLKLGTGAAAAPALVLPALAVFLAVRLWNPGVAVLAAIAAGLALASLSDAGLAPPVAAGWPRLETVVPAFDAGIAIGLGVPLFLVTMASQNLPGFAVLRAAGYAPPVGAALVTTGALSAGSAVFGAHPVSMAAITAAICVDPAVEPDPTRRWRIGLVYGAIWVALGVAGPMLIGLIGALPPALLAALVGLALLGPLNGALGAAFSAAPQRMAAGVTLVVTASGVAALGIGAAFWGLAAGIAVQLLDATAARARAGRAR